MLRRNPMFHQRGNVLFGVAGGLGLIASGFVIGYYVLGSKGEARAAVVEPAKSQPSGAITGALREFPARAIQVKTTTATVKLKWAELGIEVDPSEVRAPAGSDSELAALGATA